MPDNYELPHFGGKLMSTQVSALLMKELKNGIFSKSEKLPSEVELAERLGVSRTVIRDALSDIEREGFIERVRGIGTVICRDIVNLTNRLDLKLEYNELIVNSGYTPYTDNIKLRIEYADEENAELLNVDEGSKLIVCEKRVLAGNIPCIYSIDYLSYDLFSGIEYTDIDWSKPIFDLLDKYCGLIVVTDIAKITATNADEFIREKLQVQPKQALILLDEVGYCKLSRPVMRSLEFYTDFFDFTMLRKKF
ncbi:GntR family transcriptional regulator [Hydrogenoanaerobacterium saccharovorans]|uniref:GntR family transcriptional regulator n=1 Tax=Hydrogenoanaerobacterium saccharovorans TaxID=474960 RepID=A0A1H7Z0X5_9FIRM|nr:GntR family transcriptional regulator [Hydrogenoanaerobacterium saccharovorans]RPF48925.1 GntR family transcriptional regulator [Hydrogenoanaerobacterium saccharovorans]SEM51238.1 GntR family transcriptional regulator [Hydrogenoanaerobacterium saccharovorans]